MLLPKLLNENILMLFIMGHLAIPGKDWVIRESGEIELLKDTCNTKPIDIMVFTQGGLDYCCKTFLLNGNYWIPCYGR